MAGKALGMIEVTGLLGSIIAADIALKTADVHLVANQTIRGGLTSVELFGTVGAIKESIAAAREVVSKMGCFVSSNIIANLDPQVEKMILDSLEKNKKKQKSKQKKVDDKTVKDEPIEKTIEKEVNEESKPIIAKEESSNLTEIIKEYGITSVSELSKLKVTQLRSIAYTMNLQSLTKKEIKFAKKADLMKAIVEEGAD